MYLPTENFKGYNRYDYHSRRKINWRRFIRSAPPRRAAFAIALIILFYLMRRRVPIQAPQSFRSQVFDQLMLTEEQQSHRAEHVKRPLEDIPLKVPLEPFTGSSAFPEYSRYLTLFTEADYLPDIIHIPFEDSIEDVTLAGWEDEWQSEGLYNGAKWGVLEEPKMDFVYTCEHP